jgi:2-polyprenyl-6-methoxyphenol hydroxylase-like FAD-dependent oxidoreductase
MLGVKPSGRLPDGKTPLVTLFWSIRLNEIPAWREAGLDAWKKEAAALAPFAAPLLERIDNAGAIVPSSYHNVWMSRWTEGRAVYIGDAAHATSPQLGQGVNLGLWDAMVLAQCLQDAPDIPAGLARYHGRRRRNVRFYQLAAGFLTPFFQSDFDFLAWPRDLALGTLCRLPWTRTEGARVAAGVKTGLFSSMALEDR